MCPADPRVPGPFFLQSHVFICRDRRHWVILDANRDKYLCVDRRQFEALGPSLQGWGESASPGGSQALPVAEEAIALANGLLDLNILSDRAIAAKDARPTAVRLATEALDPDSPVRSRWSSVTHAGAFFSSCARASRELRRQPFQLTVDAVRTRKSRNAGRAGPSNLERTRSLVAVFNRLRLFYPHSYVCLFDSLSLIHFLARFNVFPDWLFGVNADPFEAHCWAQEDNVVLNDTLGRVAGFIPIMCV